MPKTLTHYRNAVDRYNAAGRTVAEFHAIARELGLDIIHIEAILNRRAA